jgi:hypothetical protein
VRPDRAEHQWRRWRRILSRQARRPRQSFRPGYPGAAPWAIARPSVRRDSMLLFSRPPSSWRLTVLSRGRAGEGRIRTVSPSRTSRRLRPKGNAVAVNGAVRRAWFPSRGTEGSNPAPSSAESRANPTSSERRPASIDLRVSLSAWRQRASYAGAYLADAIGSVSLSPASAFEGREPRLSARLCAAGLATGSQSAVRCSFRRTRQAVIAALAFAIATGTFLKGVLEYRNQNALKRFEALRLDSSRSARRR